MNFLFYTALHTALLQIEKSLACTKVLFRGKKHHIIGDAFQPVVDYKLSPDTVPSLKALHREKTRKTT